MNINHRQLNNLAAYLCENNYRLALAESMSAGFFSSVWSLQCDSGDYFQGGVVCFGEAVKTGLLGVPSSLIRLFSAESIEVTESMVRGLKKQIDADLYLGITGVAYQGVKPQVSDPGDVFLVIEFQQRIYHKILRVSTGNAGRVYIRAFNESLDFIEEVLQKAKEGGMKVG